MRGSFNYEGYFSRRNIKCIEADVTRHKSFLYGQLKIIQRITPIVASDMILEVGCGIGALISLLQEIGVRKIAAIELDPDAAVFVSQSQGVDVSTREVEHYPGKCQFDKIFALEVLEHLHNPIPALRKIHDLLRGGVFNCHDPFPIQEEYCF